MFKTKEENAVTHIYGTREHHCHIPVKNPLHYTSFKMFYQVLNKYDLILLVKKNKNIAEYILQYGTIFFYAQDKEGKCS